MKTQKITVNKTPQQPAGIEIEVVVPEGQMEERLLSFMLTMFLRDLKREKRVDYDLPQRMEVAYQGEGRYLVRAFSDNAAYYEPPRPIALVGLRWTNGRFDLVHAALGQSQSQAKREETPAAQPEQQQPEQPEQMEATTKQADETAAAQGESAEADKPQ